MWQLKEDKDNKRTYLNDTTGSSCTQTMCYAGKDGNKWYMFDNLMALPYTRQFAATKISSLYALGLSKDDLVAHIMNMKSVLRSADPEKYEKAYAAIIDFESKANNATDAIKQMSSLVCVYFTMNDEPIDSFENNLQIKKMLLLEADTDMHTFFLTLQTDAMSRYSQDLNILLQTVSQPLDGLQVPLP